MYRIQPKSTGSGRRRGVVGAAVLLLAAGAACSDAVLPQITTWEGDLRPIGPSQRASASLAVLSQSGRAGVSIQMVGGDPDVTYAWRIVDGSCQAPGEVVGGRAVYPALETGAQGSASGETVLSRELDPEGSYAGWLYRVGSGGTETVAACGALQRRR